MLERIDDAGVASVVAVPHHRTVTGGLDGLRLEDPRATPETIASTGDVRAAALAPDGGLLIATDDDLLDVTAYVGRARLADAVTLPVSRLVVDGDDLWLATADGLRLWRDGWLHDVHVGRQDTAAFAAAGGRAWLGTDAGVVGIAPSGDHWEVVASHDAAAPDALAIDRDGELFAASGGSLLRTLDGVTWREVLLPDAVTGVFANPTATGAWVATSGGLTRVDGEAAASFDVPAPEAASVDEAGRLWFVRDGALLRLSAEPGGVLVGVADHEALAGPVDVLLLPTEPDRLATITASLDDADVAVLTEPLRVSLDPDALGPGEHTLVAHATWTDGTEADLRPVTFTAAVPTVVTWTDHIDPLRRAHCAVCHDGDTRTLLDTKERWQERVDDILRETTAKRMPLTGAKLTPEELEMIEVWKDGGFL